MLFCDHEDALWLGLVTLSTLLILLYGLSFEDMTLKNWFLSSWLSVAQGIYFFLFFCLSQEEKLTLIPADAILNQPLFNFVSALIDVSVTGKVDILGLLHIHN